MEEKAQAGARRPRFTVPDDPAIRDLIPGYLANRRKDVQRLRAIIQAGDYKGVFNTGHDMHGSGSAYGIEPISNLGSRIEDAAKARDTAAILALAAELESFLDSIRIQH